MANRKSPTKREYFNRILSYAKEEDVPFILHELELLDKKNAADRKPTQKEIDKRNADANLRTAIVDEMEVGVKYSAGEMVTALPTLAAIKGMTAAKVTYLMQALVKDGSVDRVVEKRHTFYCLAE